MKKLYLLLSAACLVASASAVEKETATKSLEVAKYEKSMQLTDPVKVSANSAIKAEKASVAKVAKKVADDSYSYTYFRAEDGIQAIGSSTNGYSYGAPYGFKCVQGDLVFNNYSTNVKSNVWNYSWYKSGETLEDSSTETNLVIDSQILQYFAPTLSVTYNDDTTGSYESPAYCYLVGANAEYWGFSDDGTTGDWGLSFYQNYGYKNGNYSGSLTYMASYSPGDDDYNENGVYEEWEEYIESDLGAAVSNLTLENFVILQPKPISTYFITKGWLRCSLEVASNTQLISYIYPMEDNVIAEDPIAIGYATVTPSTVMPVFDYYPLNEDGDELEGEVYIDTAVAITIEGFNGNEAITSFSMVSGYYPFDLSAYRSGNYDICKSADMYFQFSFDVDGSSYSALLTDPYIYYLDQTNGTMSGLFYSQFTTDATYAYILAVNGEDTVTIPEAGGQVDVVVDPYYYRVKDLLEEEYYTLDAPEWVNVEVSDFDTTNGYTTLTISADATTEARTGVVSLAGFGTSLDITVNQGDVNGVSIVKAENGAVYYDLAGRRVLNPDKGIYIKVSGNKSEKVIL